MSPSLGCASPPSFPLALSSASLCPLGRPVGQARRADPLGRGELAPPPFLPPCLPLCCASPPTFRLALSSASLCPLGRPVGQARRAGPLGRGGWLRPPSSLHVSLPLLCFASQMCTDPVLKEWLDACEGWETPLYDLCSGSGGSYGILRRVVEKLRSRGAYVREGRRGRRAWCSYASRRASSSGGSSLRSPQRLSGSSCGGLSGCAYGKGARRRGWCRLRFSWPHAFDSRCRFGCTE